jgi:hypothetical protein
MTKFSYKLYRQGIDVLLAISDADIVGKTFEEGDIKVTVHEDFYSDKVCGEDKVLELVKSSTIVNAIGEQIVGLLVNERFIDNSHVLIISGIPHAQIITIQ